MKDVAIRSLAGAGRGVVVALGSIALGLCSTFAASQTSAPPSPAAAPPSRAPASAVEPAVDTSAPADAPPTTPAAQRAAAVPAATGATAKPSTPSSPPRAGTRRGGRAMDRVDLEASQITGNRELPRVLYIVPWRAPAAGDLEGRPVNSLLYELTKPVDRDVFRRENRYFDALQATATPGGDAPAGAPAAVGGGPEK
jgi:hypothetical protein